MSDTHCEKSYRTKLFKQGLLGVFILCLVFLFLESFSRWIAATSTAPFGENIRSDQKMIVSDSIRQGIVAIGDSIIARSFYPELFSSLLTKNFSKSYEVYNIGVEGSGILHHRAHLRFLLKRNVKPDFVIMNVSVHNLNLNNFAHDSNDHIIEPAYQDNNSLDYYTRCFIVDKPTIASKMYCKIAEYSYFFRLIRYYHQQLNNSLQALLHTQRLRVDNLFIKYPAVSKQGFSPNFGSLTEQSVNTPRMLEFLRYEYRHVFANFNLGTDGLDSIIDDLNNNSIKVILVLAPVYHPVTRKVYDEFNLPSNGAIVSTLENYALKKNIAFINLFEECQDPVYFQDPVHPNIYGAVKITTLLSQKIINKQFVGPDGYLDKELFQYLKSNNENKA
ncbi:DUF1574 family protein [Legionella pneumophila]|uniref:DUF1574 family protein n=1 Tax=Legionella pneumophila TaxID=446 RepID=UPI0022436EBD|nr:DUF1574 family protein [Legionella pneumophila]MCW8466750.1 DUF1574 family protein [Legionella pneumophila]MCW8488039.1 DUF1574 family protein [Legionella pneumophila]MCZ4685590.1 DUF1574 family protein [Legionella pneumophila]